MASTGELQEFVLEQKGLLERGEGGYPFVEVRIKKSQIQSMLARVFQHSQLGEDHQIKDECRVLNNNLSSLGSMQLCEGYLFDDTLTLGSDYSLSSFFENLNNRAVVLDQQNLKDAREAKLEFHPISSESEIERCSRSRSSSAVSLISIGEASSSPSLLGSRSRVLSLGSDLIDFTNDAEQVEVISETHSDESQTEAAGPIAETDVIESEAKSEVIEPIITDTVGSQLDNVSGSRSEIQRLIQSYFNLINDKIDLSSGHNTVAPGSDMFYLSKGTYSRVSGSNRHLRRIAKVCINQDQEADASVDIKPGENDTILIDLGEGSESDCGNMAFRVALEQAKESGLKMHFQDQDMDFYADKLANLMLTVESYHTRDGNRAERGSIEARVKFIQQIAHTVNSQQVGRLWALANHKLRENKGSLGFDVSRSYDATARNTQQNDAPLNSNFVFKDQHQQFKAQFSFLDPQKQHAYLLESQEMMAQEPPGPSSSASRVTETLRSLGTSNHQGREGVVGWSAG